MLGIPKFPSHFKLRLERVPVEILRSGIVTARAFIAHPSGKEEDLHTYWESIFRGYSGQYSSGLLAITVTIKKLPLGTEKFNVLIGVNELKVIWNDKHLLNHPKFGFQRYYHFTKFYTLKNLMDKRGNTPLQL